jgi:hypothetical protein
MMALGISSNGFKFPTAGMRDDDVGRSFSKGCSFKTDSVVSCSPGRVKRPTRLRFRFRSSVPVSWLGNHFFLPFLRVRAVLFSAVVYPCLSPPLFFLSFLSFWGRSSFVLFLLLLLCEPCRL